MQEGQLSITSSFKSTWNGFFGIGIDQIWWEFCSLSLIDDFSKETEIGGQAVITDAGIHPLEKWFHTCFTTIDHCLRQGINESLSLKLKEKTQSQIPRLCSFFLPFGGSKSLCHSLWSCGYSRFFFSIIENGTFLLHPSDILLLPACNGFHYFWCFET